MVALRAPAAALPIFRDAHDGAGPRRRDQSDCHTKHLSLTLDAALRPGECLLGGSAAAPLGGRARPVATASCRSACRARRGACRGRADLLPVVGCCSHTRLARDAGEHLQHRGAGGGPGARQARAPPLRNSDACLPRAGVSRCTGHGHAGQRPKRAVLSVAPCLADLLSSGTTPACSQRVCLPCSTMPSETLCARAARRPWATGPPAARPSRPRCCISTWCPSAGPRRPRPALLGPPTASPRAAYACRMCARATTGARRPALFPLAACRSPVGTGACYHFAWPPCWASRPLCSCLLGVFTEQQESAGGKCRRCCAGPRTSTQRLVKQWVS